MLSNIIAHISLIIWPFKVGQKVDKLINAVISKRLKYLLKAKEIYIQRPVYILGYKYIKCESFSSCAGLRLECWDTYKNYHYSPLLEIGHNVCFNFRCHIGVINHIKIGNNVLIGSNVLITDHSHGSTNLSSLQLHPIDRKLISKGPVVIHDDVWIGENVSILPGTTIGQGAIIGANAVVTHDVPPYSIAIGNPATIIKPNQS